MIKILILLMLFFNINVQANQDSLSNENFDFIQLENNLNIKNIEFINNNIFIGNSFQPKPRDNKGNVFCFLIIEKTINKNLKHSCISDTIENFDINTFTYDVNKFKKIDLKNRNIKDFSVNLNDNKIIIKVNYNKLDKYLNYIYIFYIMNTNTNSLTYGRIYKNFKN